MFCSETSAGSQWQSINVTILIGKARCLEGRDVRRGRGFANGQYAHAAGSR